jgi:hypothetical protein
MTTELKDAEPGVICLLCCLIGPEELKSRRHEKGPDSIR